MNIKFLKSRITKLNVRNRITLLRSTRTVYIEYWGMVELQTLLHYIHTFTSLPFIVLDGKFLLFSIDVCNSIAVIIRCHKVNLTGGSVTEKIGVLRIATYWSSA